MTRYALALQIIWFLSPVVDGVLFPDEPVVLLIRGQVLPMPYLLGVNSEEFSWLLPYVSRKDVHNSGVAKAAS